MNRSSFVTAVVGLVLTSAAVSSSAQVLGGRPVSFGIMGGASFPISGFPSGQHTGWNGGALLEVGAPLAPLRFRIEGQWHQLNGKSFQGGNAPCASPGCTTSTSLRIDVRVIDATADAVYTFASALPVKFYVIGGAGGYNVRGQVRSTLTDESSSTTTTTTESQSSTKFGVNAGLGARFRLNGFATFVEARYHVIVNGAAGNGGDDTKALQMIPISVGITF